METTRHVRLRYGSDIREISLPHDVQLEELRMREVAAAADPHSVIESALDHPIGSRPLAQAVEGAKRVIILVDDLTRPTPTHLLLPPILERLHRAGIGSADITIMVATGTHRPMTRAELEKKLGPGIVAEYNVVNHDYRDENLVYLGETRGGVPITVNRAVIDSDFVIAVGNIVPHRYCGWAGGAKMIQPGVSGEATTAATHLMITKVPNARLGVVENQVRHEIEAVADQAHLRFLVNTVLNRRAEIVDVVTGDFRRAFRRGVAQARNVYSAPFSERADVIVASAYPSDLNLWQAGKAFYSADLIVKEGGIIILASPCYEGIGEHDDFVQLLHFDYQTIEQKLAEKTVRDRIGAAAALAVALVKARAEIWLVTDSLSDRQVTTMNMRHFDTLQHAVDAALALKGPTARVTVVHEATELLPLPAEQERTDA